MPKTLESGRPHGGAGVCRVLAVALCALLAACGGGSGNDGGDDEATQLTIGPTQLLDGTTGSFYGATLFATGGAGWGYAWDLVGGALPAGVGGLPTSGVTAPLTGVLGAPGTYDFAVRLRDSNGSEATRQYSVTINPTGGANFPTNMEGAPSARYGHTAVWTGSEMIVWGGVQMTGMLTDGAAYDPAQDTWRTISPAGAPVGRFAHTAVWTGTEMIVWGGSGPGAYLADGAVYQPTGNTWRPIATGIAPTARRDHTAVWTGSSMIVWGGQGVPADSYLSSGAVMQP